MSSHPIRKSSSESLQTTHTYVPESTITINTMTSRHLKSPLLKRSRPSTASSTTSDSTFVNRTSLFSKFRSRPKSAGGKETKSEKREWKKLERMNQNPSNTRQVLPNGKTPVVTFGDLAYRYGYGGPGTANCAPRI